MTTEIRVPTLGESVTEATVGKWFKKLGEAVAMDEPLVELETDKVTVEVPSPVAGKLSEIIAKEGDTVEVNALLGVVKAGEAGVSQSFSPSATLVSAASSESEKPTSSSTMPPSPSAAKLMAENNVAKSDISGSGKRGQILKEDVLGGLKRSTNVPTPSSSATSSSATPVQETREERVRMTKLRQTIARRLKDAQNVAAMLTTFNEVDMSAVMDLRKRYKDLFEKKHGVKLGFMGFLPRLFVMH